MEHDKVMQENSKTVIIGLDGVPFGMIEDFAQSGVMENTAKLITEGTLRKMKSSIPEVSSVAWSSMITGKNPGEHGTYGFTDLYPDSYRMRFPNYNDLKSPPFWENAENAVIINVPFTYPVHQMNGVHISGFVSIDFNKSVYPPSLAPQLRELDYRLDVDSQKAHESLDLFLEDLDQTLEARISSYRWLWDNKPWQMFMLVFTGTDRLLHFLWSAYEDKSHKYHDVFLEHFRKIDRAIGEIAERLSDDDLLIMLSDHGFERLDYDININYLLAEEGLLQFKQDCDRALDNICYGTKAFVLDPARIYLNFKDKYPCGSVEPAQAEGLLDKLENIFNSLEIDGRKVIKAVHRKEQIYCGPCLDNAPDMVLIGAEGFNLKGNIKAQQLTAKPIFTGKHTYDTAFLLAKGLSDESAIPADLSISDVKQIMDLQNQSL